VRTHVKNRRRTQLRVEALEGKTLLSTGSVVHQVARRVTAAPIVAKASAAFSGTLTGSYSNIDAPGFAHILSYATSGTLTGVGSTHLRGSWFARPGAQAHRLAGRFVLRNNGGSMIVNVLQSATPRNHTYRVVRARGSDAPFKGGTGELMITQSATLSVPFYTNGQATMTFTPG
jgi:hypothetical protein